MEREYSLKTWVRDHSPIRSRNKPLPKLPCVESSPRRIPGAEISGNASQRPASRIRSLLKLKQASPSSQKVPKLRRRQSLPLDAQFRSPIRKQHYHSRHVSKNSPDLHALSQKISSLESQLREARQELDLAVETTKLRPAQGSIRMLGSEDNFDLDSSLRHGPPDELSLGKNATQRSVNHETHSKKRSYSERCDSTKSDAPNDHSELSTVHKRHPQGRSMSGPANLSSSTTQTDSRRRHRRTASELNITIIPAAPDDETNQDLAFHSNAPQPIPSSATRRRLASESYEPRGQGREKTRSRAKDEIIDVEVDLEDHPPSPRRRHVPSPTRLRRVREEYEWDEEVF